MKIHHINNWLALDKYSDFLLPIKKRHPENLDGAFYANSIESKILPNHPRRRQPLYAAEPVLQRYLLRISSQFSLLQVPDPAVWQLKLSDYFF